MTITIADETGVGMRLDSNTLQLSSDTLTLSELIAARVASEVQRYNERQQAPTVPLVQLEPSSVEMELNRPSGKARTLKLEDVEKQTYLALDAFRRNAFFVLVDNQQITSLDAQLALHPESMVSFVRLTQLVGG